MTRCSWLALVAIVGVVAGCTGEGSGSVESVIGSLPALAVDDARSPSESLVPDGRILVVNLWASWCEPCRREMASLDVLSRQSDASRLRVIGISVDEDRNLALEYLRSQPLSFGQYWDPGMTNARRTWGLTGVPATLVIGPHGDVRARVVGPRDWSSDAIRRLIFSEAAGAI